MRPRLLIPILFPFTLSAAACTGRSGETTATRPQTFVQDDRFCVAESMTVELPADRQTPVARPVGKCGNYVSEEAMKHNTISCGPCGFVLDPDVTEKARKRRPDACCYEVSSPPPPPPPRPRSTAGRPRALGLRHQLRLHGLVQPRCGLRRVVEGPLPRRRRLRGRLHLQGHRVPNLSRGPLRRPTRRRRRPPVHRARATA